MTKLCYAKEEQEMNQISENWPKIRNCLEKATKTEKNSVFFARPLQNIATFAGLRRRRNKIFGF